jgi:hypothetical protein
MDEETRERLAIVKRGQLLGFGALALMLIAIVALAVMGQPWVAETLASAGLAVVVAIFVTGRYHGDSRGSKPVEAQAVWLPAIDAPSLEAVRHHRVATHLPRAASGAGTRT